ncbi:MAG TPA: acyl carrier protein [Syntrophus sp. (in: bacteria)]|jgi:acyl carrier protein|nr:acyl carrier protein [Syntrophus sp. (in: bacteria)]
MDVLEEITIILAEILDMEGLEITPETYLIRELGAESIDLLELSVAINSRFNIEVNDDELFLRTLRIHLRAAEMEGRDAAGYLAEKYPVLTVSRVGEILADMGGGPVLRMKDIISYITCYGKN